LPQRPESGIVPVEPKVNILFLMADLTLMLNGVGLVADLSGALLWPERGLLVVADLHLEKGSSFAQRGRMLPPYDTRATLDRLKAVIERTRPRTVICLGDSFHDRRAVNRIAPEDAARLSGFMSGRDWIWVTGNHDPEPPANLGGNAAAEVTMGALSFRHEAQPEAAGEVSGHYHPVAAVRVRGRRVRARCFATDGRRLILPSFGAYTGGLNVLDRALTPLLGRRFQVHMMGRERLYEFPNTRLEPDLEPVR
jgi:DNA ligase-associated metallophosphoesterase